MRASELIRLIDTFVSVRFETLLVDCKVIDAKAAYGKVRVLVVPVTGRGEQWVEDSRIVSESK